jgi:hypothetical protein
MDGECLPAPARESETGRDRQKEDTPGGWGASRQEAGRDLLFPVI